MFLKLTKINDEQIYINFNKVDRFHKSKTVKNIGKDEQEVTLVYVAGVDKIKVLETPEQIEKMIFDYENVPLVQFVDEEEMEDYEDEKADIN